jgi:DNA polymerase delta subunit 1
MSYDIETQVPNEGISKPFYVLLDAKGKPVIDPKTKKQVRLENSGCQIYQIGFVKIQGEKRCVGIHMVGSSSHIKDADRVYCYEDEKSMLLGFFEDVRITDPTYTMTYNGDGFDNSFIVDRAKQLNVWHRCVMGRRLNVSSDYTDKSMNTSQHKSEKNFTNMDGRTQIDLLQYIMREKKLRSYSLNSVAKEFVGKQKVDLNFKMINRLQHGSPEDRAKLAYYCTIDCVLPLAISEVLKVFTNVPQLAHVAGVTVQQILNNGQQLRMFVLVLHHCSNTRDHPAAENDPNTMEYPIRVPAFPCYMVVSDDGYQGAFVLDAVKTYHDEPISTLDFNSLCESYRCDRCIVY